MKKGFTLIELLAVIVVLAIIALIATPVILGIIDKAKLGSAESSALGYIDAVEKQIMINEVKNELKITDKIYSISDLSKKNVAVKGTAPTEGVVKVENGQVVACSLRISDYVVNCINEKAKKVKAEKGGEINSSLAPEYEKISNGTPAYFNPVTGEKCNEGSVVSTTGTKSGCMKWYVFNDDGKTNSVNVILNHNTSLNCLSDDKESTLNGDTYGWKSGLNPRLISAEEILMMLNIESDVATIDVSSISFLQENAYSTTEHLDYWTSTEAIGDYPFWTYSHVDSGEETYIYDEVTDELLDVTLTEGFYLFGKDSSGIRPVITIPRSIVN